MRVDVCGRALARIAVPSADVRLIVRFDPALPGHVDVHAIGARDRIHRKRIPGGRTVLLAALRPGACETVLGVPASAVRGRTVPLEDLWGREAVQRLRGDIAETRDPRAAATLLERAIVRQAAHGRSSGVCGRRLQQALQGLQNAKVGVAARTLGVSERQLRRQFQDAFGMGPKAVARLQRFERALHAVRACDAIRWSEIAADAGYYDQAHLIAEFRAIAGVTPGRLLAELPHAV